MNPAARRSAVLLDFPGVVDDTVRSSFPVARDFTGGAARRSPVGGATLASIRRGAARSRFRLVRGARARHPLAPRPRLERARGAAAAGIDGDRALVLALAARSPFGGRGRSRQLDRVAHALRLVCSVGRRFVDHQSPPHCAGRRRRRDRLAFFRGVDVEGARQAHRPHGRTALSVDRAGGGVSLHHAAFLAPREVRPAHSLRTLHFDDVGARASHPRREVGARPKALSHRRPRSRDGAASPRRLALRTPVFARS